MGFGVIPLPVFRNKSLCVTVVVVKAKVTVEGTVECMNLLGFHCLKPQHIRQTVEVDICLGLLPYTIKHGYKTSYFRYLGRRYYHMVGTVTGHQIDQVVHLVGSWQVLNHSDCIPAALCGCNLLP